MRRRRRRPPRRRRMKSSLVLKRILSLDWSLRGQRDEGWCHTVSCSCFEGGTWFVEAVQTVVAFECCPVAVAVAGGGGGVAAGLGLDCVFVFFAASFFFPGWILPTTFDVVVGCALPVAAVIYILPFLGVNRSCAVLAAVLFVVVDVQSVAAVAIVVCFSRYCFFFWRQKKSVKIHRSRQFHRCFDRNESIAHPLRISSTCTPDYSFDGTLCWL